MVNYTTKFYFIKCFGKLKIKHPSGILTDFKTKYSLSIELVLRWRSRDPKLISNPLGKLGWCAKKMRCLLDIKQRSGVVCVIRYDWWSTFLLFYFEFHNQRGKTIYQYTLSTAENIMPRRNSFLIITFTHWSHIFEARRYIRGHTR